MPSDTESRIIRLERITAPLPRRVRELLDDLGKAEQDVGLFRGGEGLCTSTITGTIFGGRLVGFDGATARFVGATTGIDYGTATANSSGVYTFAGGIDLADTTLNIYTDHPSDGGRMDGATLVSTVGFSRCSSTTKILLGTLGSPQNGMKAASGYVYPASSSNLNPCDFPIAAVLELTDNRYGVVVTMTWDAGSSSWLGCAVVAFPGNVNCPAASAAYHYKLAWDATLDRWVLQVGAPLTPIGGGIGCPINATCATAFGGTYAFAVVQNSWTCPDPSAPTPFAVSFSIPANAGAPVLNLYPTTSSTIDIVEP